MQSISPRIMTPLSSTDPYRRCDITSKEQGEEGQIVGVIADQLDMMNN